MSKYVMSQNSRKARVWLQRMVRFWLASGIIALPWMAYGSEIVRTDGAEAGDTHSGNVHNIYAGKQINAEVGASTFSKFNLSSGDVANMQFRTATGSNNFNTLLNFVDAKININGTINAIRNGDVGGHLYFFSPNGMAVGASGAINAGSLTMLTPTQNWWDNIAQVGSIPSQGLNADALSAVQNAAVPINASGTIAVRGKVSATSDIRMKAGTINIGADETGNNVHAAEVTTGVVKFTDLVNLDESQLEAAGVNNLVAVKNGTGDILIAAEANYNENANTITDNTVKASVLVAGGSKITATGNAKVTAAASNNINIYVYENEAKELRYVVDNQDMSKAEYENNYKGARTDGYIFGSRVKTQADVTIKDQGTAVTGNWVNVQALGENNYNSTDAGKVTDLLEIPFGILLNGLDVSYGLLENSAQVYIGEGAVLTGNNAGVDVQALARMNLTVGTDTTSLNIAGQSYSPNWNLIPAVAFGLARGRNQAKVDIEGKLETGKDSGTIKVEALATSVINSSTITDLGGLGIIGLSDAAVNIGINIVNGYNKSNVTIGEKAVLSAHNDVSVSSSAVGSIQVAEKVSASDESSMVFAVAVVDYDQVSDLTVKGSVTSTEGAITLDSKANFTSNNMSAGVGLGRSWYSGLIAKNLSDGIRDTCLDNLKQFFDGKEQGSVLNGLIDQFGEDAEQDELVDPEDDGKTLSQRLSDNLKLGISLGYMRELNDSNLTLSKTAKVEAKKDLQVKAYAGYDDIVTSVTGTSANNKQVTVEKKGYVLANGALLLRKINNEADVVLETGDDQQKVILKGANVDIQSEGRIPYNRRNIVINKIKAAVGKEKVIFEEWAKTDPETFQVYKTYHDAVMVEVEKFNNDVYDSAGNFKPPYDDENQREIKLKEREEQLYNSQAYKNYQNFVEKGIYTDEHGQTKTLTVSKKWYSYVKDFISSIKALVSPASYYNFVVNAVTKDKGGAATADALGVGISFGLDRVNNNGRILVGKQAEITGTVDVSLSGTTIYQDVSADGLPMKYSQGSMYGANFTSAFGVHLLSNNSIVAVTEGAKITSGADMEALVGADVHHLGMSTIMGLNSDKSIAVQGIYLGTESNTLLAIDDEAQLKADGGITLTGYNNTSAVNAVGSVAAGNRVGFATAFGLQSIRRNNIVAVADNDTVGSLSDEEAKLVAADEYDKEGKQIKKRDDEKTRLQKLLKSRSGLGEGTKSFYSDGQQLQGSVKAANFDNYVTTTGSIVNVTADVAASTFDDSEHVGKLTKISQFMDKLKRNLVGNVAAGVSNGLKYVGNMITGSDMEYGDLEQWGEYTNPKQGMDAPSFNLAVMGSIGINSVDSITGALMEGANVTLDNTMQEKGHFQTRAEDNSALVAVTGALGITLLTHSLESNKDTKTKSFGGAASVNVVNSDVSAIVRNSTVSGVKFMTNEAVRQGAVAAAAAAIDISALDPDVKANSFAAGVNVNVGTYNTRALMDDNTVTGNGKTTLVNQATDQDAQGTGGIDLNLIKGGKSGFSAGTVISWGLLTNNVEATMKATNNKGSYTSMGDVSNVAATDLTQVGVAVGLGVSTSEEEEGSTNGTFQGTVAVNKVSNNITALAEGVTIDGKTFTLQAYDANFKKANPYLATLKTQYKLDTDGAYYLEQASKKSQQTLQDTGNSLVSVAVEVDAATGSGKNAVIGVGLVYNELNSTTSAKVKDSKITLTGTDKSTEDMDKNAARVMAESSSRTVGIAVGGNGSANSFAGAGSMVITRLNDQVQALVQNSEFSAAGLAVNALNKNTVTNVAGQIDIAKTAIGLDGVYTFLGSSTDALLENTKVGYKQEEGSALSVTATNNTDICGVAVGVAVSTEGGVAGNGSVVVNQGHNNVRAQAKSTDKKKTLSLSDFVVLSSDTTKLAAGTGGFELVLGKDPVVAVGGAISLNDIGPGWTKDTYKKEDKDTPQVNLAQVQGYEIEKLTGTMRVEATDTSNVTTVAVGVGLDDGYVAFQGADADTRLKKNTDAQVLDTNIKGDTVTKKDGTVVKTLGNLVVKASNDNSTEAWAVVLSVDTESLAIGMGLTENVYTMNTGATLAGGTMELANGLTNAYSKQVISNKTVGVDGGTWSIGGSVAVNNIADNVAATLGYADSSKVTTINTTGNLGVVSQSSEDISNVVGGGEISVAAKAAGGGAAIAVNTISGNTTALARNAVLTTGATGNWTITLHDSIADSDGNYTGLVVGADAFHNIYSVPFSGGFSAGLDKFSFGLDTTVSADYISGTTSAQVVSVDLNKVEKKNEETEAGKEEQQDKVAANSNLTVKATDKIDVRDVVTNALAGGVIPSEKKQKSMASFMLGVGVDYEKNSRTVEAAVKGDAKRKIINADQMTVQADSLAVTDVISTSVAIDVAKSTFAGDLAVGVVNLKLNETTRAIVDNVEGTNNGLTINAKHKDKLKMVSTGVTGAVNLSLKAGSAAVGVTPLIVDDTSTTEAKLLNSVIGHYDNNTAVDEIKAYSDSFIHTQATDVKVAISLISGAVGVLVSDNDLKQVVTTEVNNSTLGSDQKRAKDVSITAENKAETKFTNQNVEVGMGGVGVASGLNDVDTSVATNVLKSQIYAENDINISASENLTLYSAMVQASAGGLAVGFNTLHNYVGTAVVSEKYVSWEDKDVTSEQVEQNEYSAKRIDNITVEATQFVEDLFKNNIATSKRQDGSTWKHIDMDTEVAKKARSTKVESTGNKVNLVDASLQAKHDINVVTGYNINTDLQIIGGGLGILSVAVEQNRARVTVNSGVNITGGTWNAGNNLNVDALVTGAVNTFTVQNGVGGGQIGVNIGEITKSGDNVITLDKANLTAAKEVTVLAKDDLKLKNEGSTVQVGLSISIPAIYLTSTDNLKNNVTLMSTGNTLSGDSISLKSCAVPSVETTFNALDVGSMAVGGVVLQGTANNQALLTLEGTNSLLGNTVTLVSGVYTLGTDYSLYTDVVGNAGSMLSIRVNKARTYTDLMANTTVGSLKLKKEKKDSKEVGTTDLTIKAEDTTSIYNKIKGLTIGTSIASGTNYSTSILKSTVTTSVDGGSTDIYAKNLNIGTSSRDNLKARANGDGGGVIDISPVAAEIEVTIDGKTETNVKGKYYVAGTTTIDAVRTDELDLEVNTLQAQLAGGSGTKLFIHHLNETTQTNLNQATIESTGAVNVDAVTTVNVNKDNAYALQGNGYGGGDISVGKQTSVMNLDTKVNLLGSTVKGLDSVAIGANMNGYICLANNIYSLGVLYSGAHSTAESTITLENEVNITDSNIRSEGVGKDLIISASEYLNLYVRTYVENKAGLIGGVNPTANSTLNRNNKIVLNNSDLFSDQDINLYSGKALDGNLGFLNTKIQAESFNASVIPISVTPKAASNITQNNQITLMSGSDVQSIRHTNLYADDGREVINKKAVARDWASSKDHGSSYVTSAEGKVTGVVTRDNYVQVDTGATVTAGTANITEIIIGSTSGELVVMEEQERQLVQTDRTVYTAAEKSQFIHYDEKVAQIIGLKLDDFEIGSQSYSEAVATRLDEVNALLSTYSVDSDPTVYNSLKAESDRLSSILATLRGNSGSSEQTTGLTPNMIYYITIPKLTASGGNVVVNTGNFRGGGTVEAKGTPSVTIKNYTNLMLVTNEINVDDPGGIIYYNNTALEPGEGTDAQKLANMQKQVQKLNVASDIPVALNLLAAAGKAGSVYIYGLYDGGEIAFDGEYTSDGVKEKIKGSFKPKADVRVAGSINSLKGLVHVESANNDITIAGKSVKDNVSILGNKVEILANNGSITQGYTSGTVSIGGDVRSQYNTYYNNWLTKTSNQIGSSTDGSTKLITTEPADGSKASDNMPEGGYWIAGGQVSISAADININGIIQSGYDSFTATLTAAEQSKVDSIISNWNNAGKPEVTDTQVKNGGGTYKVSEGGAYWNATRKCYEYRLNVFYNPSTKQLLTENVDASGGRIYLTGRIASTGSGRIICLDGAYNIDINNVLNYDLKTGTLYVNDVKGLITITDSAYNYTTTVSSSGSETINNKTKEKVTGVVTGSDRSYTYNPKSDLRYEWVTGYKNTKFTPYYKESMAKWWGLASYKVQEEKTLKGWITNKEAVEGKSQTAEGAPRQDGAYLTENSQLTQDVVLRHNGTTISEKVYQDGPVERWTTGYLGCHKWTKYNFIKEQGQTFQDTCSVKASNPINISFIGSKAEESHVNVTTAQNLLLTGSLGNSQLYDVKTGDKVTGHVEKGNINLTSSQGSIIQQGGNIYGAGVNLTSAKNLENIAVIAGDTLTLSGLLKGSGTGDIEVTGAYGGGLGNVLLKDLGGTAASEVTLSTPGDITQVTGTNLVQAKRINLSSGGSVGGANGSALRLQGGQNKDASSADSLQASVNIWAEKDISISQVSGDLRIGTIYSGAGNVIIEALQGSLVDALPYEKNENKITEDELVAEWRSLGLIANEDGSRTEAQKTKDSSLVGGKTSGEDFINNIRSEYAKMLELRAKETTKRSEAEKEILSAYEAKYQGYNSAEAYLQSDNVKAQIAAFAARAETLPDQYDGWSKEALLYALQDSVINKHAGVKSSDKVPNIYGKDINITVKDDVGLNSDKTTVIDLDGNFTLNDLKTLSQADPATVSWAYNEQGHKIVTVTEKLAIGLQQIDSTGTVNINNISDTAGSSNIYVEVRKSQLDGRTGENLNLVLGNIGTGLGGDIRISSLGSILRGTDNLISGRDVVLLAGENGSVDGNIGDVTAYLNLDMTGKLTATATGNIYLHQTGLNDWYLDSMTAGVQGANKSDTSGNIYLVGEGNIYGYYNENTTVQGYLRSDSDGIISVKSISGNIGSLADKKKTVRFANSDKQGSVNLRAWEEIAVEGVSTRVGLDNAPAGTFAVTLAGDNVAQKVKLVANGTLSIGNINFTNLDSAIILEAASLGLGNDYQANTVSLQGSYYVNQMTGIVWGMEVSIISGQELDLTCGKSNLDAEGLKNGDITQTHNSNGQNPGPKIIAGTLNISGTGVVDIDSEDNQFANVHLDVNRDTTLGGGATTDELFNKIYGYEKNIQLDVTNTHGAENEAVHGNLSILLYERQEGDATDLTVNGNVKTDGSVVIYNEIGELWLPNQDDNFIRAGGSVFLYADKDVTNEKKIESDKEGVAFISRGDIVNVAEYTKAKTLYLRSLEGDVYDICLGSFGLIDGDLTLIADEGAVVNSRSYLVKGDITIEARESISNYFADEYGNGMHSTEGDITIYTTGSEEGEGYLYNSQQLLADKGNILLYANKGLANTATIDAPQGTVTILSNGTVINGDGLDANNYIYGKKGVTLVAAIELDNKTKLYADTGDIIVAGADEYSGKSAGLVVSGSGKVTNSGTIYTNTGNVLLNAGNTIDNSGDIHVGTKGNVVVSALLTLGNTGTIYTEKGNVSVTAFNALTNQNSIYTNSGNVLIHSENDSVTNLGGYIYSGSGDVTIEAGKDLSNTNSIYTTKGNVVLKAVDSATNAGSIYSGQGNVSVTADGDVLNNGSIYAISGTALLESYTANVANSDDFTSGGGTLSDYIYLLAEQGSVTNTTSLRANRDITILAKNDLTVSNGNVIESKAGDIYICSSEGNITTLADITTEDGNITLVAQNIHNGAGTKGIRAEQHTRNGFYGQVVLLAYGDLTNGVVGTTDTGIIYGQNGVSMVVGETLDNRAHIKTDTGDVLLTRPDKYVGAIIHESEQGTAVNNAGSITVTEEGNVVLYAQGHVQPDGSITGGTMSSSGAITTAKGYIYLEADGNITNDGNLQTAAAGYEGGDIRMLSNSGTLSSKGNIDAQGSVVLQSVGDMILDKSDQIGNTVMAHQGYVQMAASEGSITNKLNLMAQQGIELHAGRNIDNEGELHSVGGDVELRAAAGALTNTGIVTAGAEVVLHSENSTLENYANITGNGNVLLLSKDNMTVGTFDTLPLELSIVSKAGDVGLVSNAGKILNYARIAAVKDNAGQGGGLVAMLSGGELDNYGSIAAEKNVHLYGYNGLKNYTGADIVTQNGDVAINQSTYFKYRNYITWLEPVGNVWNMGSIAVQQKGNILISTPGIPVNNNTQVTNGGTLGTADGNIIISSKGSLNNGGDIYALNGGRVELAAQDNVVNSGNILIYSEGQGLGDVTLIAYEGDVINTGSFVELSGSLTYDMNLPVMSLIDGDILLSAEHGNVENDHGLAAVKDITIRAYGTLNNGNLLEWEGAEYGMYSREGNISLVSLGGDIINQVGLCAEEGNVELRAREDVNNSGSIFAHGDRERDTGLVSITSETGDIRHTGSLYDEGNQFTYAEGSIHLLAPEGAIFTSQDLIANNDIVVMSRDAVVKQESGGDTGNLGIRSLEQGDIYLYAYGTDEKGVVYNNGILETTNGSIYIQANGSVEEELEVYGVKQTAQVSVYNSAAGDIHAQGGNVYINGLNTVVNKGDILVQRENYHGGDLSIASKQGSVLLYNEGVTPESPQGTNIFLADGDIRITAPSGVLYNEKNLLARGDVDLHYGGGGMNTSITINNVIASQYGDISITTAGDLSELILASRITALEGKVDVTSGWKLTIGNYAEEGEYTVKANDTIILNAVNDIRVYGKIQSETGSVNIASKKIAPEANKKTLFALGVEEQTLPKIVTVKGDIEAPEGVAAVGSDYGSIEVTGNITGKKVVLYTEEGDANITFQKGDGKVSVGEELILAGNHWNDGTIDMSKINNGDTSGYVLNLFRARNSTEGSKFVLDFGSSTTPVIIANAAVDNLVIHTEAPIKIGSLNVTDRADIYAMGTKTSVYGKMHAYDADAKVIYYSRGNGESCINLHEMFFDGTAEQYRNYTEFLLEDTEQFVHYGGRGGSENKGMTLDIKSPTWQYGDGLLLRNYYGQKTDDGRRSLEQWMQHLLNIKAIDEYKEYFMKGYEIFDRYNLLEIPDVTVNQPVNLKEGRFEVEK